MKTFNSLAALPSTSKNIAEVLTLAKNQSKP